MRKMVFLDRDGTIIVDEIYLNNPDEICYLPGVFEGCRKLRDQGFEFAIATNQSGIPRGKVQISQIREIHRRIKNEFARHGVEILSFYYAPFMPDSNHFMRKPNPGMIEEGLSDFNADRKSSWMAGDRLTDIIAGQRAGLRTVFLEGTEKIDRSPKAQYKPHFIAQNFLELTEFILETSSKARE